MSIVLPRHAEIWLLDYVRSAFRSRRESKQRDGVVDILFAIADHFEPLHGGVSLEAGLRRVERWVEHYPKMASQFTDADGRHPQHTFFFPIEQYRPEFLEPLAELCHRGFGEVEVHLHHDNDTAARLRERLNEFTHTLHDRHGLLSRDESGRIRYGFVHGNWALDNSLPDRRWCGVQGELSVLHDTGCYADFTMPAAPSPAQTRTVNQLYYASCSQPGPKAHDRGRRAAVGRPAAPDDLLMVQGPLAITRRGAKWRVVPRLDAGALDAGNPPTAARFADWVSCGISVAGRPDWIFVKVHTHGAPERNADMLLGQKLGAFHTDVLAAFNDGQRFRLHYVTTREMVNIIGAAMRRQAGSPALHRNVGLSRLPTCQ